MSTTISEIHDQLNAVSPGSSLVLDQTFLGESIFRALQQHFPQATYRVHTIMGLEDSVEQGIPTLRFLGILETFLEKSDVAANFLFIELEGEVHLLLDSPIGESSFFTFADIVSPVSEEDFDREEFVNLYLVDLSLGDSARSLFSTISHSDTAPDSNNSYPTELGSNLLPPGLERGINLGVSGTPIEGLATFFQGTLGFTSFAFQAAPPQCKGLVYYEGETGRFRYSYPVESVISLPSLEHIAVYFLEIGLEFPLVNTGEFYPQIIWEGNLRIGKSSDALQLRIGAFFDLYHKVLAIECRDFPGFLDFLEKAAIEGVKDLLISPFDSIFNIRLSLLRLAFDLKSPILSEVSLRLTCDPIVIIENILEFQPAFNLEIGHPFDSDYRDIRGEFEGHWEVAEKQLLTSISFPRLSIYAGLAEGETMDTTALTAWLKKHADLPDEFFPSVTFHRLALKGKIRQKSFSFDLEAATNWEIGPLEVEKIQFQMSMTHDGANYQKSFYLSADLKIDSVHIYLSAEYQTGEGFRFRGSSGQGEEIKVGQMLDSLIAKMGAEDHSLPDAIRKLTMRNLLVRFDTKGNYEFSIVTALELEGKEFSLYVYLRKSVEGENKKWEVVGSLYLGIGVELAVAFSKDKDSTAVIGTLTPVEPLEFDSERLIGFISPDKAKIVPFNVGISLRGLLLGMQSKSADTQPPPKTTEKEYLFRLLFDLDFSMKDFPLVGEMLKDIRFTNGQLLAADKNWEANDVAVLNDLIGLLGENAPAPLETPQQSTATTGISRGISLSGTFQVSEALHFPLFLNFAGSDSITEQQTGASGGRLQGNSETQRAEETGGTQKSSSDKESDNKQTATPDQRSQSKINKVFSAVKLKKVSLIFQKGRLGFKLTGGLSLAVLEFELIGLQVTVPQSVLNDPSDLNDIEFGLDGFGAAIQKGPMSIMGAFMHIEHPTKKEKDKGETKEYDEYAGVIQVQLTKLGLAGLGSYAKFKDADGEEHTSLFLFVALSFPIPVHPSLLITGMSLGFGLHRDAIAPKLEDVLTYPLVQMAVTPPPPMDIEQILASMNQYFPVTTDQYFVVAGIKFKAFSLVDTLAMLLVKFGRSFEINLIGISSVFFPKAAFIELAWTARFVPDTGYLFIGGQLTNRSFLLIPEVRLTGGFAVAAWMKGIHAGDFVVSVGGYHPRFKVPSHYPKHIPRLGISFYLDPVTIKGGVYFAITPECLMMGGFLDASLDEGWIEAHLKIHMDAIIHFEPFHYDVVVGVDASVKATIGVGIFSKTFNLHLHIDCHIWGPEFSGTASLDVGPKTFEVEFGAGSSVRALPISWKAFKSKFLQSEENTNTYKDSKVCTASISKGLLQKKIHESKEIYIVDPKQLEIEVKSLIPLTNGKTNSNLGIAPMDLRGSSFSSNQTVTISKAGESKNHFHFIDKTPLDEVISEDLRKEYPSVDELLHKEPGVVSEGDTLNSFLKKCSTEVIIVQKVNDAVPKGIWGTEGLGSSKVPNGDPMLVDAPTGSLFTAPPDKETEESHEIDKESFKYNTDAFELLDKISTVKMTGISKENDFRDKPGNSFFEFTGLDEADVVTLEKKYLLHEDLVECKFA